MVLVNDNINHNFKILASMKKSVSVKLSKIMKYIYIYIYIQK